MTNKDINEDGRIDEREVELALKKTRTQRLLAIAAFVFNVLFIFMVLGLLAAGALTVDHVSAMTGLGGMYLTANAGLVATYFGVEAGWLTKK